MAVLYEPTSRTTLIKYLRPLNIRDIADKHYTTSTIELKLRTLVSAGLLVQQDSRYHCHRSVVESITRELVAAGRFERIAKIVQQTAPAMGAFIGMGMRTRGYEQAVRELRIGQQSVGPTAVAYSDWKLRPAKEP